MITGSRLERQQTTGGGAEHVRDERQREDSDDPDRATRVRLRPLEEQIRLDQATRSVLLRRTNSDDGVPATM